MIFKGFKRVKRVQPGELIRSQDGMYAILSEYRSQRGRVHYDGYVYETGEALHMDGNDWVAVIDLSAVEKETALLDEMGNYPDDDNRTP